MTSSIFAARRKQLAQQLGAGAVAIIPSAPERVRSRDTLHPYRQDSQFFYLSGFVEPHACLVLYADGRSLLFCQPKDLERETWDGVRLGPQAAPAALGVDEARPGTQLEDDMPRLLHNCQRLYFPFSGHGEHGGLERRVHAWLGRVRAQERNGAPCPQELRNLDPLVDDMRLVKDAHELETMRRAAAISARGHLRAMRRAAAMLRAGEDLREHHLEAELLHEFRQSGAQAVAYGSIVAGGANACVLHYPAGSHPVRDGDLVLIDAGCELDGYASDITRTFPASGLFSAAQRQLYDLVLASQQAAIHAIRPGARFDAAHEAALAVLAQGMLDVGLLDRQRHGNAQDVLEKKAYLPFYMHRTSHWLGLDVHDCGSYVEADGGSRILQPGMCLTVEPGIYVRPGPDVPERFHHIGIRIEDDALVTPRGCELSTRDVPVQAEEIEAWMRG